MKTGRNTFHTTFYDEIDAMKCRIKDSYDEISHKIPTEWSHDGKLRLGACRVIRVLHFIDIESAFG